MPRFPPCALALAAAVAVAASPAAASPVTARPAAAPSPTTAPPTAAPSPVTEPHPAASLAAGRTVWLCRPGLASNPCTANRTTTAIAADGSRRIVRFPAQRRRIDCFYVYPTVSAQPTINADRRIDARIRTVATFQASRFSSTCRVFAPVYRQVTVGGLTRPFDETRRAVDRAYRDVRAAWRDYLAHHNHGRGVVLIGHSQGTGLLTRLLAHEIDGRPGVRRRLVSALLLGGNVLVPARRDVGGSFKHIPACRSRTQTGCVVAYSSFLQTPPDPSLFARGPKSGFEALFGTGATGRDLRTLCVNPADPGGRGETPLRAFFHTGDRTPWVTYPGRYRGRCATSGTASWLQVDPRPGDPRPVVQQFLGPAWGLHASDVDLTLGDLVRLVKQQSHAYISRT